jgi:hypothetical protein
MCKKRETHKNFSTCFDNMGFVEMKKLMSVKGVGSLCAEMIGRITSREKRDTSCLDIMWKMVTEQGNTGKAQEKGRESDPCDSKKDHRRDP